MLETMTREKQFPKFPNLFSWPLFLMGKSKNHPGFICLLFTLLLLFPIHATICQHLLERKFWLTRHSIMERDHTAQVESPECGQVGKALIINLQFVYKGKLFVVKFKISSWAFEFLPRVLNYLLVQLEIIGKPVGKQKHVLIIMFLVLNIWL